jgi:hypothetical protein
MAASHPLKRGGHKLPPLWGQPTHLHPSHGWQGVFMFLIFYINGIIVFSPSFKLFDIKTNEGLKFRMGPILGLKFIKL